MKVTTIFYKIGSRRDKKVNNSDSPDISGRMATLGMRLLVLHLPAPDIAFDFAIIIIGLL